MGESALKEFKRELEHFDTAMLVTQRGDELRSRPMAIAGRSGEGHLWFITSVDSAKLDELTESPFVNVALQEGQRFMSISGVVRATRDQDAVREYWTETQRVWFEQGREDPELILLEIVPTYAEYWDRAGVEGVRFMLAQARAIVQGETMTGDEATHEKVEFPGHREKTARRSDMGS